MCYEFASVDAELRICPVTIESPSSQVLCEIKGLSEAKVEKCVEAAKKMVPQFGWQSASMFATKVSPIAIIFLEKSASFSSSRCGYRVTWQFPH